MSRPRTITAYAARSLVIPAYAGLHILGASFLIQYPIMGWEA